MSSPNYSSIFWRPTQAQASELVNADFNFKSTMLQDRESSLMPHDSAMHGCLTLASNAAPQNRPSGGAEAIFGLESRDTPSFDSFGHSQANQNTSLAVDWDAHHAPNPLPPSFNQATPQGSQFKGPFLDQPYIQRSPFADVGAGEPLFGEIFNASSFQTNGLESSTLPTSAAERSHVVSPFARSARFDLTPQVSLDALNAENRWIPLPVDHSAGRTENNENPPNFIHCRLTFAAPNTCSKCFAHFRTNSALNNHAKITRHAAYKCTCQATFSRLDCLNRHVQDFVTGPGAGAFPCRYCRKHIGDKAFTRKYHLAQHLRGYHKIETELLGTFILMGS
ncbi:hypothetical protein G7Y89_g1270 [Cudoniella acicularis]|uniref:C2H2-type domain-containing protein n=1 Tax=Cudoniella acicularis TaxID=354080 RepID=A0A8H4W7K7_9HELO|nr:hypothetical protein G7Y89_g1270 [Cudoniella acicularis]